MQIILQLPWGIIDTISCAYDNETITYGYNQDNEYIHQPHKFFYAIL